MANPSLIEVLNVNNPQTLVSGANLNALANSAAVLSGIASNIYNDGKGGGFPVADLWLHLSSMTVVSGSVTLFALLAPDGSNFSQGGASLIPTLTPLAVFTPYVQTAVIDITLRDISMPICGAFKLLLQQTLGNSLPADALGYVKAYYHTPSSIQV